MRLAVSNTPAAVAWAAYDGAMVELQDMYLSPVQADNAAALRAARLKKAEEAVRYWHEWRELFLRDGGGQ